MPSDLVALLRCPNATGTNGFIKRKRQEMEGKKYEKFSTESQFQFKM